MILVMGGVIYYFKVFLALIPTALKKIPKIVPVWRKTELKFFSFSKKLSE